MKKEDLMSVHDSRNWKATESTNFGGGDRKLRLTGEVQVGASNQEPVLTEAVPQGINPKILVLELSTVDESDAGTDVLTWKETRFEKAISEDQYDQVDVSGQAVVDVDKLIS